MLRKADFCVSKVKTESRETGSQNRKMEKNDELFSDDDLDRIVEDSPSVASRQGGQKNRQIQRVRCCSFVTVNGHFCPYCSLDGVHMVSKLRIPLKTYFLQYILRFSLETSAYIYSSNIISPLTNSNTFSCETFDQKVAIYCIPFNYLKKFSLKERYINIV